MMRYGRLIAGVAVMVAAIVMTPGSAWCDQGSTAPPSQAQPGTAPLTGPPPPVLLEPRQIDLGYANPSRIATGVIKLRNTSSRPLTIGRVQPTCKCTTPELSSMTIPPGQTVEMKAGVDLRGSLGKISKTINVFVNGYSQPVQVKIVGEMGYAVRCTPAEFRSDVSAQGNLELEAMDGKPFRVLRVNGLAPSIISQSPAGADKAIRWTVAYDLTVNSPMLDYYIIETDHPDAPVLDPRVLGGELAAIEGRFFTSKLLFGRHNTNIGILRAGESVEIDVGMVRADRTKPMTWEIRVPDLSIELVSLEVDPKDPQWEKAVVRVTSAAERDAPLVGAIVVRQEDLQARMFITGRLMPARTGGGAAEGGAEKP